jgi:hypothetical protein
MAANKAALQQFITIIADVSRLFCVKSADGELTTSKKTLTSSMSY